MRNFGPSLNLIKCARYSDCACATNESFVIFIEGTELSAILCQNDVVSLSVTTNSNMAL